jgi:hypothetical protein
MLATALPLAMAIADVRALGDVCRKALSSMLGAMTSNCDTTDRRISARRGELEPKIIRKEPSLTQSKLSRTLLVLFSVQEPTLLVFLARTAGTRIIATDVLSVQRRF